ncbi:uncharacterized protein EV154DRAFT_538701 [Mucor mucedo]|uniref:uncharacterized protein n=1 Tax=Mucor mucedo TaxID=29922 RepID=UPI002220680A|nr:uncharacterized protein EV154DRAFT_538701 [Mucor mucedo]KAI7889773.1 hypothetical protein EV154DRAFT_538701 [Mucor mucedo]
MTDLSTSSQISLIGDRAKAVLIRYLDDFGGEGNSDHNIVEITKPLSKMKNQRKMKGYYRRFLIKYEPRNDMERNVYNVYKHMGETKAANCTAQSLDFKLDLRITVNIEQEQHEVATAELAKSKSTTESKLYNDKVKLALTRLRLIFGTKCHLNSLLRSMPYIPKSRIKDVKVPNIQIMGLTCHVKALSLIDKGVYMSQDVYSFDYPRAHAQIQENGIQKIIEALKLLTKNNPSKMDSLLKGRKQNHLDIESGNGDGNNNVKNRISEVVCDDNVGHDH